MGISTTESVAPTLVRPTKPLLVATATRSLSGTGLTDIVNFSGQGKLQEVVLFVKTAPTGSPTALLQAAIDGQTKITLATLYNAGIVWPDAVRGFGVIGDGDAIGDLMRFPLPTDFNTSCVITLEVTIAGSAGEIVGSVLYNEEF